MTMLRTGYALITDNTFRYKAANAVADNLDVGVYHQSYALSEADAVQEAQHAISEVKLAGLPDSTVIYYDLNQESVEYAKKHGIKMGSFMVNNLATAFCETVNASGYKAGIKCTKKFMEDYYWVTVLKRYHNVVTDWPLTTELDTRILQAL